MSDPRVHEVVTTDGVAIRATVHGDGPHLVFLQGLIGDGDLDWRALLPHLNDRFTCHLPSWRGRGLSDDHPDLSLGRLISDAVAYVESIAEPTGVVGWSAGAMHALLVAAESDSVQAVAPFEPVTPRLMDERALLAAAVARTGELAAEDRLPEAVRAFADFVMSDEEIATVDDLDYLADAAKYVPNMLRVFQQAMAHRAPHHRRPRGPRRHLRAGACPARIGHQEVRDGGCTACGRPRSRCTTPRDPRRRPRCPADPSGGARARDQRGLHIDASFSVTRLSSWRANLLRPRLCAPERGAANATDS